MSKYKFTSLLSSQYRSVFKSFHSLDRYEKQLRQNNSHSVQKRQTSLSNQYVPCKQALSVQKKFQTISYDLPSFNSENKKNLSLTSSYKQGKMRPSAFNTAQNNFVRNLTDKDRLKEKEKQIMVDRIRNKYETTNACHSNQNLKLQSYEQSGQNHSHSTLFNHLGSDFRNQLPSRVPFMTLNTIDHSKNELKMKVSQINKKRNDLKLKVRVNDIDKINKKYSYLHAQPQNQRNQEKIYSLEDNISFCKGQIRKPLMQTNSNQIIFKPSRHNFMTDSIKIQQAGVCRIQENKKTGQKMKVIQTTLNDEENIQTPHFYQTQTKKRDLDALLIQRKLSNLAKKTFKDRYDFS